MENKLTAEQIEKIKECKNMEELKKLVQTENIELTDEQLEEVAGGMPVKQIVPPLLDPEEPQKPQKINPAHLGKRKGGKL